MINNINIVSDVTSHSFKLKLEEYNDLIPEIQNIIKNEYDIFEIKLEHVNQINKNIYKFIKENLPFLNEDINTKFCRYAFEYFEGKKYKLNLKIELEAEIYLLILLHNFFNLILIKNGRVFTYSDSFRKKFYLEEIVFFLRNNWMVDKNKLIDYLLTKHIELSENRLKNILTDLLNIGIVDIYNITNQITLTSKGNLIN